MNSVDYNRIFEQITDGFEGKRRLLLHTCCAPCASAVLERVTPFFDVTLFFFNPNIDSESEYYKRAAELDKLNGRFEIRSVIVPDFLPQVYLNAVKGREDCREGGDRCALCFELRLSETAKMCRLTNSEFFATTLTVSPHKNAALINAAGERLSGESAVYLPSDFKKKDGYKRSIVLSEELSLYRQCYCGCSFSKSGN